MPTSFSHVCDTQFPLPAAKEGESLEDVAKRGLETALQLLHDPTMMVKHEKEKLEMITLKATDKNAVNVYDLAEEFHVQLDPNDSLNQPGSGTTQWNHLEIKEYIPLVLGMTKQIVFQTALRYNENGMEALSNPGNSVTVYGKYTVAVSEGDPRSLTLRELTTTHCNMVLAWYIKSTIAKSHRNIHDFLRERFVERMSQKNDL